MFIAPSFLIDPREMASAITLVTSSREEYFLTACS